MTTCVILQSNYIPWKGYFQLIDKADIFVFYDIVQYTKNDWRNRNRIVTQNGPTWLTIPVSVNSDTLIDEVQLPQGKWRKNHPKTVRHSYGKTSHMSDAVELLATRLNDSTITSLSELNQKLITDISNYLGIETKFVNSRDLEPQGERIDKLIDICNKVGADTYLSGPAARDYIGDEFEQAGITLEWMEYGPYPVYDQAGPEFSHQVSILDLIAHLGKDAINHLR